MVWDSFINFEAELDVDRNEVGLGQQRVEINLPCPQFRVGRLVGVLVVVEHLHAPTPVTPLGHREPDSSHSDDPDGFSTEVQADMSPGFPSLPLSSTDVIGGFDDPACGGDHQGAGHPERAGGSVRCVIISL